MQVLARGPRRSPAVVALLGLAAVVLLAGGLWLASGAGDRGGARAAAGGTTPPEPPPTPTGSTGPTTTLATTTTTTTRPDLGIDEVTLSPDGTDRFDVAWDHGDLTATAPADNRGTGLRIGVVPRGVAVTADEQVCVTWHGPTDRIAQAGLVLRVRTEGDRTRAILVTNNVFMSYRTGFNVHLLDSATATRFQKVDGLSLPGSLGAGPATQEPLPWRLCARLVGSTITIKAWPLAARPDEPAWDDPDATGTIQLPPGWAEPGRPGVFVGHLSPGEQVAFSDLEVDATP